MTVMVKYFKVTNAKFQYPMYYAAYTEESAKREVHSDLNSQVAFSITEVDSASCGNVIHCCSDLSYEDAKQVARELNQ
jgi:hypothetical protein